MERIKIFYDENGVMIPDNEEKQVSPTNHSCYEFIILKNDYISSKLKEYGYFSPTEIFFLRKLIKETDNVIEIGANIGSHAVHLSKCNPKGKYFAFEPQIDIFKILTANLVLNSLEAKLSGAELLNASASGTCDNVIPYNYGIGLEDKTVWYSEDKIEEQNRGAFIIPDPISGFFAPKENEGNKSEFGNKSSDLFLKIKSINYFEELFKLDSLKLIKIDVETHEVMVLKNLNNIIVKYKPIIFVEWSTRTFFDVCITLRDYGYKVYYFVTAQSQYELSKRTKFVGSEASKQSVIDEALHSWSNDVNVVAFHNDGDEECRELQNYASKILPEWRGEFLQNRNPFIRFDRIFDTDIYDVKN